MQPYFFPYIGYFQLINDCSEFIIYDDVQYTKKGWINRNKIASGQNVFPITINVSKHEERVLIRDIRISNDFSRERLFRRISGANSGSPFKAEVDGLIREIIMFQTESLFEYLFHSIVVLSDLLGIKTPLRISSEVGDFKHLKGEDKVIQICRQLEADVYLNPMGGMHLYSKKRFSDHGMLLKGFESKLAPTDMDNSEHVTLSIVNSLYKEGIVRTSARAREEMKPLDSNY